MRIGKWVLFERYVIGPAEDPYMVRWRLFECPWFRVYFHRILRDDSDRHLHDHPFNFLSFIVRGGYVEWRQVDCCLWHSLMYACAGSVKRAPSLLYRRATDLHRLTLIDGKPAWTIVIGGRRLRDWGFQTETGWMPWQQYLATHKDA